MSLIKLVYFHSWSSHIIWGMCEWILKHSWASPKLLLIASYPLLPGSSILLPSQRSAAAQTALENNLITLNCLSTLDDFLRALVLWTLTWLQKMSLSQRENYKSPFSLPLPHSKGWGGGGEELSERIKYFSGRMLACTYAYNFFL